jgi:hypothetical protein
MCRLLLGSFVLAVVTAFASASEAAQPSAPAEDQCVEELKSGQSEWVECRGAFETDASAQEELARQTFDMVRNARCGGTIRVQRAALMNALARNGILELDPQNLLCSVDTKGDFAPQATLTLAPKVLFQGKRIADISPNLVRVTNFPEFMMGPLRSAAESEFVRKQLVKGLNTYLQQAFPK